MQSNLQTAIYNLIQTTNDFKTSIGGRFAFNNVSNGTATPYCVGFVLNQVPDYDTINNWERFRVQFSIFQNRANTENILDIATKLMALMDNANLTLTGYKQVSIIRQLSNFMELDTYEIDKYDVIYLIEIQKN